MQNALKLMLAAACCGMLLTAGCAKKEVVKKETPAEAPAITAPAPPAPPPVQEPVKETPVATEKVPTSEELASMTEDATASKLFQTIYFDFDSFVLSDAARDALAKNAAALKKNKGMKVQIQGNCDERGSDAYNLALGEKRARAAYNYLVSLGVPAGQLLIISYGEERPADPGHNEAAWAKNRRDDFVVLK